MNTLEVLKAAQELIRTPETWTKGFDARNSAGEPVYNKHDGRPVCWCAAGALREVTGLDNPGEARVALDKSCDELFEAWVVVVNDLKGHTAVMAVYDHAIAKLEAE